MQIDRNVTSSRSILSGLRRLFIPKYDETSLFSMSLSVLFLLIVYGEFRVELYEMLFGDGEVKGSIRLFVLTVGFLYPFYHVIASRPKTDFEKASMLGFAIFVNGVGGYLAGAHVYSDEFGIAAIAPAWNIANSILLIVLYRFGVIDESSVCDDNAPFMMAMISFTTIAIVFSACAFLFHMYWTLTLSICIAYSSSVSSFVRDWVSTRVR